jgi:hypothetical protein
MKYLFKFEDFKQQEYTVDDLVKLSNGEIAKIIKINQKSSYIVHIMKNQAFIPTPIAGRDSDDGGIYITELIQAASNPAIGSDIIKKAVNDPNNSMVINGGYPDTPLANTINY